MITDRSVRYAQCCSAAFSAPAIAYILFDELGYSNVREIVNEDTSTTAYVMTGHGSTVVVFKASKELRDWVTNFNVRLTPLSWWHSTQVHKGFLKAFSSIMDDLRVVLMEPKYEGPITFAGHSLGGALAQVAASYFYDQIVDVMTYGAPRVFDAKGAAYFNSVIPHFRHEVSGDAIVRMPKPFMGYRHTGYHIFLTKNDGCLTNPSTAVQFKHNFRDIINEIRTWSWASWEDHKIALYIRKIKQCLCA